ncbi:hypothetical protein M0P65_05855 [Candidatus Gracilibacteria bacterium]|jgi:hypothetical protein|nr:hypothetical protein [Candidatus Gracilibacteria bacterium]
MLLHKYAIINTDKNKIYKTLFTDNLMALRLETKLNKEAKADKLYHVKRVVSNNNKN